MPTLAELPDVEETASRGLANAGLRSYSGIPSTPTFPLCVVSRLGGTPVERHAIDRARIQVDVWGVTKKSVRDYAEAARRALHALEATTDATNGSFVHAVDDELGLRWLPETDRDRYTFAVRITARKT